MSQADVQIIARALFNAVHHIHTHGVIHSDIKPENILVFQIPFSESAIRLTDFGLARLIAEAPFPRDSSGTWLYWAPELWQGGPRTKSTDIWACGIVLFACLIGHLPYKPDWQHVQEAVLAGLPNLIPDLATSDVCDTGKRFLRALLDPDPSLRPTAAQALCTNWLSPTPDASRMKLECMPPATGLDEHASWRPFALHWLHPCEQAVLEQLSV
jgi:calcium/calmodulin-dependent protein kinase I